MAQLLTHVCVLSMQEYLKRYHDFLLTASGLGLQTLDEQRHWEALCHMTFPLRLTRAATV